MTTYHIHTPKDTFIIKVSNNICIQVPPFMSNFLGKGWCYTLQLIEAFGADVVPEINNTTSDWVEHEGVLYELHYSPGRTHLKRISKHYNNRITDISFNSLPTIIKEGLI